MTQQDSQYLILAKTDVGKVRDHNEDNFIVCQDLAENQWHFTGQNFAQGKLGSLLVVADGMGGTNAGEVASQITIESIKELMAKLPDNLIGNIPARADYLKRIIIESHNRIIAHAKKNKETEGMGTTCIIAWVENNKAVISWSGDSRAYIHSQGKLSQLSQDHSMVWELVTAGTLTPEEARTHPESNIITQCLGDPSHPPQPESLIIDISTGDKFMLCSDGLSGEVSDPLMETMFNESKTVAELCTDLIDAANNAGGKDNITVIIAVANAVSGILTPEPARANATTMGNPLKQSPNTIITAETALIKPKKSPIMWIVLAVLVISVAVFYFMFKKPKANTAATAVENLDSNNTKQEANILGDSNSEIEKPVADTKPEKEETSPEIANQIKVKIPAMLDRQNQIELSYKLVKSKLIQQTLTGAAKDSADNMNRYYDKYVNQMKKVNANPSLDLIKQLGRMNVADNLAKRVERLIAYVNDALKSNSSVVKPPVMNKLPIKSDNEEKNNDKQSGE